MGFTAYLESIPLDILSDINLLYTRKDYREHISVHSIIMYLLHMHMSRDHVQPPLLGHVTHRCVL